jgi:hypothetical protein
VITLPIHPLAGQSVAVEGLKRQSGRQYVRVRHPDGSTVCIPIDWTDRWPARRVPEVDEQGALLDAQGLRQAALVVADWQSRVRQKVDTDREGTTLAAGGANRPRPGVGEALGGNPRAGSGNLGASGSTGARRVGHRGEK